MYRFFLKKIFPNLIPKQQFSSFSHPSFMIIGTQKGGTTSLFNYLRQNPRIAKSRQKEIFFFDYHYHQGQAWYRSHFPIRSAKEKSKLYFDATPNYIVNSHVPVRIRLMYPHMQFIVLLRNPVERAYSSYQHEVRKGRETRTFAEAMAFEIEFVSDDITDLQDHFFYHLNESHQLENYAYLYRSKYALLLTKWFEQFPREQFLIMSSEHFYANTTVAMQQVCQFIGIEHDEATIFSVRNSGGNYEQIDPKLRQQLANYFQPYNEKLYAMLGVDYGWE